MYFYINSKTELILHIPKTEPILNTCVIFNRDKERVFRKAAGNTHGPSEIVLAYVPQEEAARRKPETFTLTVDFSKDVPQLVVTGTDELGVMYGLLYISRKYMGIEPFWYWNDQEIQKLDEAAVPAQPYASKPFRVRYRGWFVNDEVLLLGWRSDKYAAETWKPVFEALLRCGGNMVIPGTGVTSRHMEKLASDMGLYLTQHHAEPLGAELFLSAYPDLEASYKKHRDLFEKLWNEAIHRQQGKKIVWNLGFRGQGDKAFWMDDPAFTDDASRGKMISEIIRRQYELLKQSIPEPVCCTNLYGEIMQLYEEGYLDIPEGVIKIWADNGYGKMVSRRQGNDNPRTYALPQKDDRGPHGLYYHIAFHDLQASNHLTMSPNTPEFINIELKKALASGADYYLILNCGSIKPHIYFLDYVAKMWTDGDCDPQRHKEKYISQYFPGIAAGFSDGVSDFLSAPLQYGNQDDEKAGEEFYHYPARTIAVHWMKHMDDTCDDSLAWAAGKKKFSAQVTWYKNICRLGSEKWAPVCEKLETIARKAEPHNARLVKDTFLLQSILHASGCLGAFRLCEAYQFYQSDDIFNAWLKVSQSLNAYRRGIREMRDSEHGEWANFYSNDCLCNLELTIYTLETLRSYLRVLGDGPDFIRWHRKYVMPKAEKRIMLQTAVTKQPDDEELFEAILRLKPCLKDESCTNQE